jgi:hypothetical protein
MLDNQSQLPGGARSIAGADADVRAGPAAGGGAGVVAGAGDEPHFIVLVTKFTQVREVLPGLLQGVSVLPDVRLVIKPHPAETAEPYRAAATAAGAANVVIAPPGLDLARLLAVARLLVTVNSTVAIDAIALGVPALIVDLPNNLTPFVEAGVMAGVLAGGTDISQRIRALMHDDAARGALLNRARAFAAGQAMQADGRAAERAAEAAIGIMTGSRGTRVG